MFQPRRRVNIISNQSVEMILHTMRSITDEAKSVSQIRNRNLLFFGTIEAPEFVIYNMPVEMARNFLIEIKGRIIKNDDSVQIDLDVRPVRFIRVFAMLWLAFAFLFFILSFFLSHHPMPTLVAAAMCVFGILFFHICFSIISNKAIKNLYELLT